jgi:hypothetical protein
MGSNIRTAGGEGELLARIEAPTPRRDFLRWTGVAAAAVLVGCTDDNTRTIVEVNPPPPVPPPVDPQNPSGAQAVTINAANDVGILNYAFALEQLEAAFYTQVIATPYAGMTDQERRILTDLRDHEIVHREFFRAAINGAAPNGALPNLTPNFAAVNFASRESVLNTAQTFEDLGVAAYNGAARFLASVDLLLIAGKIVSVEARHAAAIRDLIRPRSNNYAPDAFDQALPPSRVLAAADPFIQNPITVTNAPAGF